MSEKQHSSITDYSLILVCSKYDICTILIKKLSRCLAGYSDHNGLASLAGVLSQFDQNMILTQFYIPAKLLKGVALKIFTNSRLATASKS